MWAVGKAGIKDPCKAFDSSTWKNISWEDKEHTESRLGCIGDVRCFLEISMSWRCHVGTGRRASGVQGVDREAAGDAMAAGCLGLAASVASGPLPFFSEPRPPFSVPRWREGLGSASMGPSSSVIRGFYVSPAAGSLLGHCSVTAQPFLKISVSCYF